jgi:hypothetical protein
LSTDPRFQEAIVEFISEMESWKKWKHRILETSTLKLNF